MASNVKLNSAGMRELLTSAGLAAELHARAERIAAAARAVAPVASGEYRDSIHVEDEVHGDRVVSRAYADAPHAMVVEAAHGTLGRSLDAGG